MWPSEAPAYPVRTWQSWSGQFHVALLEGGVLCGEFEQLQTVLPGQFADHVRLDRSRAPRGRS
jgi:hypothetical protein